jgi:predicted phage tail protein/sulfur carrier protein ThiS
MGEAYQGVLPLEKLSVIKIPNPFDRTARDVCAVDFKRGTSLLDLRLAEFEAHVPVVVSLNGRIVPKDELALTFPRDGDQILMVPEIQGGRKGVGKTILRAVAMIVVAVVAWVAAPAIIGAGGSILGLSTAASTALVAGALTMVGGMIVNALIPAPKPSLSTNDTPSSVGSSMDSTQTYTWGPTTLQAQGIPVPHVYGKHRVYGNVLGGYIHDGFGNDQYANVLIGIGIGPIAGLSDFWINDIPVSNMRGVSIEARYGHIEQPATSFFYHTMIEHSLSLGLNEGTPVYWTSINDDFDALEVEIQWPQGLYRQPTPQEQQQISELLRYYPQYAEQLAVKFVSQTVSIAVRRIGTSEWLPVTRQAVQVAREVRRGHWSAGRWETITEQVGIEMSGGLGFPVYETRTVWSEVERGSEVATDHIEGEAYTLPPTHPCYWELYYYTQIYGYWQWHWFDDGTEIVYSTEMVDYYTVNRAVTQPVRCMWRIDGLRHGRYEVRMQVTPASVNKTDQADKRYVASITEVSYDVHTYPRLATVGIRALATDQLNGSLRFSCLCKGKLVQVYRNGVRSIEWSDNPAWVMLDLLSQPVLNNQLQIVRFDGYSTDAGKFDIPKFEELAAFCDELVPDGNGGMERRFVFNGVFDGEQSAWEAALDVGAMCRATPFFLGTKITLAIDKPTDVSQLFTVGNIELDSFEEVFLPMEERAAEVSIDFTDETSNYERQKIAVVHNDLNNKTNKVSLQPKGETRPSGAWRIGIYQLANNLYIKRTASLTVNLDAIASTLGDVVAVQHDVPRWGMQGGRLASVVVVNGYTTSVQLDEAVTIEPGKNYAVLLRLEDGAIITRSVTNGAGETDTLVLSSPAPEITSPLDVIYSFGESDKVTKPFRIVGVQKLPDWKFQLKLAEYNESIYGCDYLIPPIDTANYSAVDSMPSVVNLQATERMRRNPDGTLISCIDLSWQRPVNSNYNYGKVWMRIGNNAWVYQGDAQGEGYTFEHAIEGLTYSFAVATVTHLNVEQALADAPKVALTAVGLAAPPSQVENFMIQQLGSDLRLTWSHIPEVDRWGYEIRTGVTWETARVVRSGVQENSLTIPAEMNGTFRYWIKAIDTTGHFSQQATSADISIANINEQINAVIQRDEMTKPSPADGDKVNLVYINDFHALVMPQSLTDSDVATLTDNDLSGFTDVSSTTGTYTTLAMDALSVGPVTIRLQSLVDAEDEAASDNSFPTRTDLDYPKDTDSHISTNVWQALEYCYSTDNATWSEWLPYTGPVEHYLRYVKVRFSMQVESTTVRAMLTNLMIVLDVQDITITIPALAIAATTGTDISYATYGKTFFSTPVVRATLVNDTAAKVPVISNETKTGCHIDLRNTSGAAVAGAVNVEISGY